MQYETAKRTQQGGRLPVKNSLPQLQRSQKIAKTRELRVQNAQENLNTKHKKKGNKKDKSGGRQRAHDCFTTAQKKKGGLGEKYRARKNKNIQ